MRYWIIILLLLCLQPGQAQKYAIRLEPLCWSISGQDSSINRIVQISTRSSQTRTISYINAAGNQVDVSAGGSFTLGWCACNNTGGLALTGQDPFLQSIAWVEPRKNKRRK